LQRAVESFRGLIADLILFQPVFDRLSAGRAAVLLVGGCEVFFRIPREPGFGIHGRRRDVLHCARVRLRLRGFGLRHIEPGVPAVIPRIPAIFAAFGEIKHRHGYSSHQFVPVASAGSPPPPFHHGP
jgi:hypothetical protein